MAPNSATLITESAVTAPRRRKSASLKAQVLVKPEPDAGASHVLLERLLAMARRYRNEGKLREAMELYWELAEDHIGAPEAGVASTVLLEMAASYERSEAPHMARSIYKRLLDQGD